MQRSSRWIFGVLLGLCFLSLHFMRATFLRHNLYPAPPVLVSTPSQPLLEVHLEGANGENIVGWAFRAETSDSQGRGTSLLVLHGNGENLATMERSGQFQLLQETGVSFLAIDYPGYGRSEGLPSESANIAAGVAAFSWLAQQNPHDRIAIWGWSLGAAVGIQVAARTDSLDGLVALSPWSSLQAVAVEHFPRWLVRLALTEKYDSLAAAEAISCPVLVAHGVEDRIIPASQGQQVADAFQNLFQWIEVSGAGHNDLLGMSAIWQGFDDFLEHLGREDGLR